jgi:tetratricopeptide (TPR) repeat protein
VTGERRELARAEALLAAGRPEEALRELATLPADQATDPAGFALRAAALGTLERWQEAADAARAGLAASGPNPVLLGQLGKARHELGDLPGAERALLDALALAPHDVSLLCAYGSLCMEAGQLDKAAKLVERAVAQAPGAAVVYATRIRLAYAQGRDREAQRLSRAYVAAYPEDPAAHAALGGMSAVRGQVGPAYAGLRQAAGTAPASSEFAEAALAARIASHPLLLPVRPVLRFGPVKVWLAAMAVMVGGYLLGLPEPLALVLVGTWVAFVAYSWIVPPLVARRLRRRWQ